MEVHSSDISSRELTVWSVVGGQAPGTAPWVLHRLSTAFTQK